jgi:hypothetical protein
VDRVDYRPPIADAAEQRQRSRQFRPRLGLVRKSLSACESVCSIETMPRATAEGQARGSKSWIREEARRLLLEER